MSETEEKRRVREREEEGEGQDLSGNYACEGEDLQGREHVAGGDAVDADAALAAAAVASSLDAERRPAPLVLCALLTLARDRYPRRRTEVAHRVVCVGVGGSDATVLVGIGGDIGDELLDRQRNQAGEARVGVGRWRQARLGHVEVDDCFG